jgi:hypothetical protein
MSFVTVARAAGRELFRELGAPRSSEFEVPANAIEAVVLVRRILPRLHVPEDTPGVAALRELREVEGVVGGPFVVRPRAGVDHWSAGGIESAAKSRVRVVHRFDIRMATIDFERIDAPLRKLLRVSRPVTVRSLKPRVSSACLRANIPIYSICENKRLWHAHYCGPFRYNHLQRPSKSPR